MMQISPPPLSVKDLDLMKRLKAYADGTETWYGTPPSQALGENKGCQLLYSSVLQFAGLIGDLLDKIDAHEMESFTIHDHHHSLKVAHIMWHILKEERRVRLTPPEIALLICSAYLHDAAMFVSKEERQRRLEPESDLWIRLEMDHHSLKRFEEQKLRLAKEGPGPRQLRIARQLCQAEEALLCQDTRERHATPERYRALLNELRDFHLRDKQKIPDVDVLLSHEGDSFLDKLVDICVSHNEPAEELVRPDPRNINMPRFPTDYPVGSQIADTRLVAAALRLADILDFDRERTPAVIYHYLLPTALNPEDDRSVLEWSKHLAISNWEITADSVVFRARCQNHIVHHAIVQFCRAIQGEVSSTRIAVDAARKQGWEFMLPEIVRAEIVEEGYRYVPYEFTLDDERIYRLLMGGAIYDNPLDAIRELIQNSVDACRLRDQLTRLYEPENEPRTSGRIRVEYIEPDHLCAYPRLVVQDSGTGMDAMVIERWFLQVGRSYYKSAEFARYRADLRVKNLDFAPVSEFGIGFLSSFLLAEKVEVETALWRPIRGDARKRTIEIHGPTRLIRMSEDSNIGAKPFRGTRVTLTLTRGHGLEQAQPITWNDLETYVRKVCVSLPYTLHLAHSTECSLDEYEIHPRALHVELPPDVESVALRIAVDDERSCLRGEIVLLDASKMRAQWQSSIKQMPFDIIEEPEQPEGAFRRSSPRMRVLPSRLSRGGFLIGAIGALPHAWEVPCVAGAELQVTWQHGEHKEYPATTLSRNALVMKRDCDNHVLRIWLSWLIKNNHLVPQGFLEDVHNPWQSIPRTGIEWLEEFSALDVYKLASLNWAGDVAGPDGVGRWERGEVRFLPLWPTIRLADALLNIVLPQVSSRAYMRDKRNVGLVMHVTSPETDWLAAIGSCRSFISQRKEWSHFCEVRDIDPPVLYLVKEKVLNAAHQNAVEAAFAPEEIPLLLEALLIACPEVSFGPTVLTRSELEILVRLQESDALSGLAVGGLFDVRTIRKLKLPGSD